MMEPCLPLLDTIVGIEVDTDALLEDVARSAARILVVVIVALAVYLIIKRITWPLINVALRERMAGEPEVEIEKRARTLWAVITTTLQFTIAAIAVVTILPEFGINIGPLIAGLGLLGLAIGFGAQSLVKDVITGLFILVENQYAVGDVVEVGGVFALVEDINLRRTVLRDLDGAVHVVPHSQVTNTANYSKSYSRVNLNVRVSYDADLDQVIEVINRVGRELAADPEWGPKIKEPPAVLRVDNLGDWAIEVKIVGDTEPIEQWAVAGELRLRLKKAFDREGIAFPLPSYPLTRRDLYAAGDSET